MIKAAILEQVERKAQIGELAKRLSLPIVQDPVKSDVQCLLHFENEVNALSVSLLAHPQWQPFYVDFCAGALNWRREHGGGELLVRAIQGRKKDARTIWDATAGLGRDSFILASHGYQVTLHERNPFVAVLLEDALQRASQSEVPELSEIFARMCLTNIDASDVLLNALEKASADIERPDVIYLDPMFPESKNTALVKKNMQIFHQLVGHDDDAQCLLAPARKLALKRVVVKRPVKAPFLADLAPAYQLTGKAIRFDVYLPTS